MPNSSDYDDIFIKLLSLHQLPLPSHRNWVITEQYHYSYLSQQYLKKFSSSKCMNISTEIIWSQDGCRYLHSAEMTLEITDIIAKDLDDIKFPIGIFLDLSMAYNI